MSLTATARQAFAVISNPGRWPHWTGDLLSSTLPLVTSLALVLAIAWSLANITWLVLEPPADVSPTAAAPAAKSPVTRTPQEDVSRVVNLHLFGKANVASAATTTPVDAPDTKLNLTLHGVFVATEVRDGAAIIGQAGGEQRFYRVGDTISGGALLEEVRSDQVVLSRNGQYEALRFPRTPGLAVPSPAAAPARSAGLAPYREEILSDPQKLMTYVQIVPLRREGELQGFRIFPQKGHEQFYRDLGLQVHDVVTSVNGVSLNDPSVAMSIMKELGNADQIVLEVNRQGRPETVTVNLR